MSQAWAFTISRINSRDVGKAGKPIGTVGPNPEMVRKYLDYGFTWIAINSDIGMMVNRAQEWLAKVKSGAKS